MTTSTPDGSDALTDDGADVSTAAGDAPGVVLRRRLEWIDTDAADRWHHGVVLRWVEAAEAELHRQLGISGDTFGATPRVRYAADFHAAVHFDDQVEIAFGVSALGRTSVTYAFEVRLLDGPRVASGHVVTVYADGNGPAPWPDRLRTALGGD